MRATARVQSAGSAQATAARVGLMAKAPVLIRSLVLVLAAPHFLFSLNPAMSALSYPHTSWTQEEGSSLPAIQALAQTADGYLWLGTGNGLIRFDGVKFVPWEPKPGEQLPDRDIRFLLPSPELGLWIGTASGLARLHNGRLLRYPFVDRWLGGVNPASMMQDHAGNLWIAGGLATDYGLRELRRDGSIKAYSRADGLPAQKVMNLFEDSHWNLWLGTQNGICRWSPGTPADCPAVGPLNVFATAETAGGELILGDRGGKGLLQFDRGKVKSLLSRLGGASLQPRRIMRDRDGNIWIGTAGRGLLRLRGAHYERITRKDGLSSDYVTGLLEDREGNLWISTARGVDEFREPKVLHLSTLDGLSSDVILAVSAARDGSVWAASGSGLNHVSGNQIRQYLGRSGLPDTTAASVYEDSAGRLWVGTTSGLAYRDRGRFVEVHAPGGDHFKLVFAITEDPAGVIIAADAQKGLFSIRAGIAEKLVIPGTGKKNVYQVLSARNGVLWVGYYQGGLAALKGNLVRLYDEHQGVGAGPVQAIFEDRQGAIWVGTREGLSRFRDGTWTTWTEQDGFPQGGIFGIAEDDQDALWLMTRSGILRLPVATLDHYQRRAHGHLALAVYGRTEGVRLTAGAIMANPRISKSRDGRIWIATEDGITVIDPSRIRSNPLPPPVAIEQVLVDGKRIDTDSPSVRFRGSEVQLAYTGLSLTVPERVRFRYRLDGLDREWTDAGTRRNVTYVNLTPGKYRFRVIAANNDGVWNTTGAGLPFQIVPYFYQTRWFAALCVTLAALLAWCVYRLRVRRLLARFQLVAQERLRVTRELHDSLLQGFSGVVLQLEAAARQFESNPARSKERLERATDQADRSLSEARRAIMSMRLPALETQTLPEALSAVGSRAIEGTSIAFHLAVKGHVRQLPYDPQANLYLVGREAILNAVTHARASCITAQLIYSSRETRLTVQDDGVGFDLQTAMAKTGHWGVLGMQERARQLGARFSIDSARGQGTKIEVALPKKR